MKIIFYDDDDIDGYVEAMHVALQHQYVNGIPSGNLLGMRIKQKFYSAKWNKKSITIRGNNSHN